MQKFQNIWIKNLKKRYEETSDKRIMVLIGEKIKEIEQTSDFNVGHMINEGDTDILIIYENDPNTQEKKITIEIWRINKATKNLSPNHPFIKKCKDLAPNKEYNPTKEDFF